MPRMPLTELSKAMARIETKLNRAPNLKGAKVMTDIENAPNTYFLRRPSGIMGLDIHLGGGLPAGGLTYLSGPDGAGKTYLLYKFIAMGQRLYGDAFATALGVSEAAPDHFFMRKCGIMLRIPEEMIAERVHERKERGEKPFTKEELALLRMKTVGKVKILRGSNGEELLGAIIDVFESKCFDIVSLDSISAVLPEADEGKDLDEAAKRAAAALMLTRFFQHYLNGTTGYSGSNPTTVIFTSQVRSNSKKAEAPGHIAKYLPDYVAQGAWAAKHGKLIDILIKSGAKDKEAVKVPGGATLGEIAEDAKKQRKTQVGKTVQYEVMKGKAGIHEGITGEFDFPFDTLVDTQRSVLVSAAQLGLVKEESGMLTFMDGRTGEPMPGLINIAGFERMSDMLRADFDLELQLRRSVLSAAGVQCSYR